MGNDPDKVFVIPELLLNLTPCIDFSSCFDPNMDFGKPPALRAVVDGVASFLTPPLYPAFLSFPGFSPSLNMRPLTFRHKRPVTALLLLGVLGGLSQETECHTAAYTGFTRATFWRCGSLLCLALISGVGAGDTGPRPLVWGGLYREDCRCVSGRFW